MKKVNEHGWVVEYRKGTAWNETGKYWYMECKVCRVPTKVGSDNLLSTTCSTCVSTGLKEFDENARS